MVDLSSGFFNFIISDSQNREVSGTTQTARQETVTTFCPFTTKATTF